MDKISKSQRSWNMSRIQSKNTRPEMFIRKLLFKNGFRYRLNDKNLPGKPDIVFKLKKKVIFIHGCFWHRHENCKNATFPKTNRKFWNDKFSKNIKRDQKVYSDLKFMGWSYHVIWECNIKKHKENIIEDLKLFLKN